MTEQTMPSAAEQPQGKKRVPRIVHFHAVIEVFSPVKMLEGDRVEILLGGEPTVLPIASSRSEKVRNNPPQPEQIYLLRLWFRTTDGVVTDLALGNFEPVKQGRQNLTSRKPRFQIAARIAAVNKDEGFITLTIETNSAGALQEPFSVDVWAALELMGKLQRPGRTMIFSGDYRPGSGRLVLKDVAPRLVGPRPERREEDKRDKKERVRKESSTENV